MFSLFQPQPENSLDQVNGKLIIPDPKGNKHLDSKFEHLALHLYQLEDNLTANQDKGKQEYLLQVNSILFLLKKLENTQSAAISKQLENFRVLKKSQGNLENTYWHLMVVILAVGVFLSFLLFLSNLNRPSCLKKSQQTAPMISWVSHTNSLTR